MDKYIDSCTDILSKNKKLSELNLMQICFVYQGYVSSFIEIGIYR